MEAGGGQAEGGVEGQHSPPLPGGMQRAGLSASGRGEGPRGMGVQKEGGHKGTQGELVDMKAKHADVHAHTDAGNGPSHR